jgi:hypothetical protein
MKPDAKRNQPLYETDGKPYGNVVRMNGEEVPEGTVVVLTPESITNRVPDSKNLWTVAAAYDFAAAIQSGPEEV